VAPKARRVSATARNRGRRGSRSPLVRLGVLVLGVLVVCGAGSAFGYRALRSSSLFDVHEVVVSGANATLSSQVQDAVKTSVHGRSLLALSPGAVARAIEEVPGVHVARVDRDFPSTLRVHVWPEHAVALAVSGHDRVVVSATGRVLARIGRRSRPPNLPRVGLPGRGVPAPGTRIRNPQVLSKIAAAHAIPQHFGGQVGWVKIDPAHGLYLQLHWPALPIRLGPAVDLREKLRAASLVLHAYPTTALRQGLRYVDVSAPARPAVLPVNPDPATASLSADTTVDGSTDDGSTSDSTIDSTDSATTDTGQPTSTSSGP
jgi:hypothetical protein